MFCSLGCDWAAAERPPDDPDRQDRRQKDGREIDEQLMHVLPPGCGIPEMDGRVKGEKRCADHCRRPSRRRRGEPRQRRAAKSISDADVADEMGVEGAGGGNAGDRGIPGSWHPEHHETVGRESYSENPGNSTAHVSHLLWH
jgi:hypothetical protein